MLTYDWHQGAIVDRVMLHPTNWIVFTTCLLSRCRIELTKVQTVDRACMQMQVELTKVELTSVN